MLVLRSLVNYVENQNDDSMSNQSENCSKISELENDLSASSADSSVTPIKVDQPSPGVEKKCFKRKLDEFLKNDRETLRKLVQNKLMLSEWLVDVPNDFYTNWYIKCCPRGKRVLMISANGQTKVYARTGYFMFKFNSILPGGSSNKFQKRKSKSTILDCVYVECEHTFYVLDVITWNGCTFYDCDTEFRFFWLKTRFDEELQPVETRSNDAMETDQSPSIQSKLFKFSPLPFYDCTEENIKAHANGPYSFNGKIDGILFYHKNAPYVPGTTPLVCWLKPDMISNILNISI